MNKDLKVCSGGCDNWAYKSKYCDSCKSRLFGKRSSWKNQYVDENTRVRVSGSYCRDGEERTDFQIIDRKSGEKTHLSIDTDGNTSDWGTRSTK